MPTSTVKPLPTPFPSEVENYRIALYERCLSLLSQHLNAVHGEDHDTRYWRIIIGPWLLHFIYYLHYRYGRLHSPSEREKRGPSLLIPYDYLSYILLFDEGNYAPQLDMLLSASDIEADLSGAQVIHRLYGQTLGRKAAILKLAVPLSRVLARFAEAGLAHPYISRKAIVKLWLRSRGRICPLFFSQELKEGLRADPGMRRWADEEGEPADPFESVVHRIVLKQMPFLYLEGYKECREETRLPRHRMKTLFSSIGWQQADPFKILAASLHEGGVKTIGHQHGGLFGISKTRFTEQEAKNCDRFFTWGWDGHNNTEPFLSIKASESAKHFRRLKERSHHANDILYATTSGSPYFPDHIGCPSGKQFLRYLEWEVEFLKSLDPLARKEIVVRIHHDDGRFGWNQRQRIESAGLPMRFDNSSPFLEALSRAKLFIADNNFTTFLESYACDVPTVLFFDPELWPIHPRAMPVFKRMEEVGLFHPSPTSAARHVDRISREPLTWWSSFSVAKVKEEFCALFVKTSDNFERHLSERLLSETDRDR